MNFQVTARKWRPQTFAEVVGQEHITTTLINAFQNDRVAHAYIFAGPRGVGKTTTARILAKTLNCLSPVNGEPCNKCDMCKSFLASQSLDIIEIDGASNRRIEEIRTLRESVKYAPTKGNYKVYIIDEVHMLTTESFNALLKTLEEPPEHTVFIFATTDIHKVPPTIISRCQRFDFRRIELPAIKALLKKIADAEKIEIDDQSLTLIAKKADGALRDAQSLFDQVISFSGSKIEADELSTMLNLIDEEVYFKISDAMLSKNFAAAFEVTKEVYEKGWNFLDFTNGMIEHFRNILTVVIKGNADLVDSVDVYKKQYIKYAGSFSEGDLLRVLDFLNKVQYELKSSPNERLKIEISLAHLIGLEKSGTISQLLSNLENLDTTKLDDLLTGSKSNANYSAEKKKIEPIVKPAKPKNDQLGRDLTSKLENRTEEKVIEENIKTPDNVDINYIKNNWNEFMESVNKEKFSVASHLHNSKPIDLNDRNLAVELNTKEDLEIISDSFKNIECLQEVAKSLFGKSFIFKFSVSEANSSESSKSNLKTSKKNIDSPIAAAIKKELGGKEINSH
ncbi:MAG: DNA polymerase III subunit gamma/tau [Ignavibacteriae bacterium]|nr:DNA polymerase III subunit gamma/tau [Ignavibacteriota bacterium]NOG97320.1 DNA polymerase III subunit gamma/tau [Ignavibacteriota bacterium]